MGSVNLLHIVLDYTGPDNPRIAEPEQYVQFAESSLIPVAYSRDWNMHIYLQYGMDFRDKARGLKSLAEQPVLNCWLVELMHLLYYYH